MKYLVRGIALSLLVCFCFVASARAVSVTLNASDSKSINPSNFNWNDDMLRAYRSTFWGPMMARWDSLTDITPTALWSVILLLVPLMIVGFYPQLLVNGTYFDYSQIQKIKTSLKE